MQNREQVTQAILVAKVQKGITWQQVADAVGQSKEWTTAGCLGQMTFNVAQATIVAELFDLDENGAAWLQVVPYKGSFTQSVPSDPLLYRLYEMINVYGSTIKSLIHEEFGDGIMSAIDFSMDIKREENSAGDRVSIGLSGKFLPYKSY